MKEKTVQQLIPLVEALVYYSQISTVRNVIPAGMLPHDEAWRAAQRWLYENCKIVNGEYKLSSTEADKPLPNSPVKEDWKEKFIDKWAYDISFHNNPINIVNWIETNIIKVNL